MINPLNDRILVLPDEPMKRTKGGLELPDVSLERPVMGTVLAVGPKVLAREITVFARVLYGKFSGSEMEIEGHECVMLREDEIVGAEGADEVPLEHLIRGVQERLIALGIELKNVEEAEDTEPVELTGEDSGKSGEDRINRLRELASNNIVEGWNGDGR